MELSEKLQELRKQKGLTQKELADALYVSRTAVSKWESGRGYPSIDSLKRIAKLYSITVDELLSGEQLLSLAEEDARQNEDRRCDIVFGLLDISCSLLLFLPLFAQRTDASIIGVSLLTLSNVSTYLKAIFYTAIALITLCGVITLAPGGERAAFFNTAKRKLSLILSAVTTLIFVISLHPYAAILLLVFLAIKVLMLIK